jgi:rhombotail lipoprotein
MTVTIIVLLLFSLSGCASSRGFNREAMQAMVRTEPDVVTDRDIARVLEMQPELPVPFRLAVYFTTHRAPFHFSIQRPNWLTADKELVLGSLKPLKDEIVIKTAFVLADSTVQGSLNRDIRMAAARYNADVVLIVNGAAAVDRYNNQSAAWYATILGAYVAAGTHSDALFMIEGTVWDVRTGYLYGTQTAEGTAQSVGPAASLQDKEVVTRAKEAALESFGKHTADLLRLMKEKFRRSSSAPRGG